MRTYSINYTLHLNRDYSALWKALNALGAVRVLDSFWLVGTDLTMVEIGNLLTACTDGDDDVVVLELLHGVDWFTRRQITGAAWLASHVGPATHFAA